MKKSKLLNTKVVLDNNIKFPRLIQFTNQEETKFPISLLDEDILNAKSVEYLINRIIYDALRSGRIAGSDLKNNIYFDSITEQDIEKYPPNYVDGEIYNVIDKPITIGGQYMLLQFGYQDVIKTNYYISFPKLKTELSKNEGNLLSFDDNGDLYCSLYWLNN